MEEASGVAVIYTTFASEEDASKVGRSLIEDKLAACVNILPGMKSIYRWQDAIEESSEVVMLVKTRHELHGKVVDAIVNWHPYSVPAILVLTPSKVASSYLEWVKSSTLALSE